MQVKHHLFLRFKNRVRVPDKSEIINPSPHSVAVFPHGANGPCRLCNAQRHITAV